MIKNKSIVFIILIVIACGIMWALDYVSSLPPSEDAETSGLVKEPKVVRDFELFCDTLSSSNWEPSAFQERVDRLNVYKAKDIVNASEFINLEEYMYSAYASSLNNSYATWKNGCDAASLRDLHSEMKRISPINSASKNKLKATLLEINGFYALLGTPQKVDYMQRSEYSEAQFNQLLAQVKSLPNYFNRCSNVNTVKRESEISLNAFKNFAINYNDAVNVYKINPKDYYAKKDMVKLCKTAKESNYTFYITQLNQLNVCQ
jgi:hypothetical protein